MDAGLSLDNTVSERVESKKPSLPEDRERIISICNDLLCSGRPLVEILEDIKRLTDGPVRNLVEFGAPSRIIGLAKDCPTPASQELPGLQEEPNPGPSVPWPGLQRGLRFQRTLVAIGLILLSFATIGGYVQLGTAGRQPIPNRQNEVQLMRELRERGQFLSKSLRPAIDNAELRDVRQLNDAVKLRVRGAKAIKLLFAPGGGESFYYAVSWPSGGGDLEAERRKLSRLGILDRLAASCQNGAPFELLGSDPISGNEGIAVNPLWTPAGCWVVVSFFPIDLFSVPNTPASWTELSVEMVRSEALPQP